ncbi:MAG: DUF4287 domain-containing protein [Actinobacteria bacterium]|nr:DUF4287 domain-containing protein [Actinomycetota bacterium]
MSATEGERSKHFSAIEKKHGKPASHWLGLLKKLGDAKYPDQIAFLREKHSFSQAHANALVMHHRGSTTSRRFATPKDYFASLAPTHAKTAKKIFGVIQKKYPTLELVVAWNQPMLKSGDTYVFGLSASKNHLTINMFSPTLLKSSSDQLADYKVNKHTFIVPADWDIDAALLIRLMKARLAE